MADHVSSSLIESLFTYLAIQGFVPVHASNNYFDPSTENSPEYHAYARELINIVAAVRRGRKPLPRSPPGCAWPKIDQKHLDAIVESLPEAEHVVKIRESKREEPATGYSTRPIAAPVEVSDSPITQNNNDTMDGQGYYVPREKGVFQLTAEEKKRLGYAHPSDMSASKVADDKNAVDETLAATAPVDDGTVKNTVEQKNTMEEGLGSATAGDQSANANTGSTQLGQVVAAAATDNTTSAPGASNEANANDDAFSKRLAAALHAMPDSRPAPPGKYRICDTLLYFKAHNNRRRTKYVSPYAQPFPATGESLLPPTVPKPAPIEKLSGEVGYLLGRNTFVPIKYDFMPTMPAANNAQSGPVSDSMQEAVDPANNDTQSGPVADSAYTNSFVPINSNNVAPKPVAVPSITKIAYATAHARVFQQDKQYVPTATLPAAAPAAAAPTSKVKSLLLCDVVVNGPFTIPDNEASLTDEELLDAITPATIRIRTDNNNSARRSWSDQETIFLAHLREAGKDHGEIAEILKRSKASVENKYYMTYGNNAKDQTWPPRYAEVKAFWQQRKSRPVMNVIGGVGGVGVAAQQTGGVQNGGIVDAQQTGIAQNGGNEIADDEDDDMDEDEDDDTEDDDTEDDDDDMDEDNQHDDVETLEYDEDVEMTDAE